jgi:hypothetical protein
MSSATGLLLRPSWRLPLQYSDGDLSIGEAMVVIEARVELGDESPAFFSEVVVSVTMAMRLCTKSIC